MIYNRRSSVKGEMCMINQSLQVGDTVRLPVEPTGKEFTGTVIYIHPKRWFFRVEYITELGDRIREAYVFTDTRVKASGIRI